MHKFENTNIWQKSMSSAEGDPHAELKADLCSDYRGFWKRAVTLSGQIQKDLPNLTLHDETHFNALWEVADLIIGPDYSLNPLELYVLGGAILMHDIANCIVAYEQGLETIKNTPEYQDAIADVYAESSDPSEEKESYALFETLRALHAERAQDMANFSIKIGPNSQYLIENGQLREHYGPIIGQIAASHHWNIGDLSTRLPDELGALGGYPSIWKIRPIVLACLLRCADAAQLDQERAPDFLLGLLDLKGLSADHWKAQNRLAKPFVPEADQNSLRFTSTKAFTPSDAEAWWISFDAVNVANFELKNSNTLLRDLSFPPFAINRIDGAETPSRLSKYIRVKDWSPVLAGLKASKVEKIVDLFGGEKIYGTENYHVPLRELIQNAADAINQRRQLDEDFTGKITIGVVYRKEGDDYTLSVEDNGLGMSEAVLTGPLIDFGSSYISSALVKSERPGLLSKSRKRIGKFGIGFFSSFMLSDEVRVISRPFDRGLNEAKELKFERGLIARPLLVEPRGEDLNPSVSTKIILNIEKENLAKLLTYEDRHRGEPISVSLCELISGLCPMLDVDVFVTDVDGTKKAHSEQWHESDKLTWLKQISFITKDSPESVTQYLENHYERLRFIDETNPALGLAAVSYIESFEQFYLFSGVKTIGTLRASNHTHFLGTIDNTADTVDRLNGEPLDVEALSHWATEQANIATSLDITFTQRETYAINVVEFGGDPTSIIPFFLNGNWVELEEFASIIQKEKVLYLPIGAAKTKHRNGLYRYYIGQVRNKNSYMNFKTDEIEYLKPVLALSEENYSLHQYYSVSENCLQKPEGITKFIIDYLKLDNDQFSFQIVNNQHLANYIGQESKRENLKPGDAVICDVAELKLL